jgi:hypothetical protein
MNRTTAEKLEQILRNVSAELDRSIRIVRDNSSEEDFIRYRRLVGKLMGEIFVEVLQPIYLEYPELTPDGLKRAE